MELSDSSSGRSPAASNVEGSARGGVEIGAVGASHERVSAGKVPGSEEVATDEVLGPPRIVAVIDIGVSSIRMAVAEIRPCRDEGVRILEQLVQPVDLGRSVFSQRRLKRGSIEKAASVMLGYRKMLDEYGVDVQRDVRVVATTAVREATNAMAFADRIFVATGFRVRPIDEAEVNRITYVGVMPQLDAHPHLSDGKTVVVEVGGGTTEMLVIRGGNVLQSGSYRMGSIRSAAGPDRVAAGSVRRRGMFENQVRQTLAQMTDAVVRDAGAELPTVELLALGGDVRFAAHQLNEDWDGEAPIGIDTQSFAELTDVIARLELDEIVRQYGVSYIEAETLGPALSIYRILAEQLSRDTIYVAETNLRDGLLRDIQRGGDWTADFRHQIIRSAIALGRRYRFDETHGRNVAESSKSLFEALEPMHHLSPRHGVLLYVAALLHEIGMIVNVRSNHKHAMYLIRNSNMFGLSRHECFLVSLIVRYHRRSYPKPQHSDFAGLSQVERIVVAKLAAILRIAISLDDRRSGLLNSPQVRIVGDEVHITADRVDDVSMERLAVRENSGLFRDVFGMSVRLGTGRN